MHYGGKTESLTPSVIGSSSSSSLLVGGRSLQINTEKRVALCSNNMLLTFTVQIYTKLNILWENLDVLDVLVSALHRHHQNTECRNMGENAAPTLQQHFRGIENKSHEELKLFNSVQFHLYWTITSKISDFIKGNPTVPHRASSWWHVPLLCCFFILSIKINLLWWFSWFISHFLPSKYKVRCSWTGQHFASFTL